MHHDLIEGVKGRILGVLPTAFDIEVHDSPQGKLNLSLTLAPFKHRFWLRRQNGLWHLEEHRINSSPFRHGDVQPQKEFQILIAELISSGNSRPEVDVIELRCPEDSRRLFGKIVVQRPLPEGVRESLLEFSCPQCKRANHEVTMHYFSNLDGKFVKTEALEPWVKREVSPWFRPSSDHDDEHGAFLSSGEPLQASEIHAR
jgi:hypothetical protein